MLRLHELYASLLFADGILRVEHQNDLFTWNFNVFLSHSAPTVYWFLPPAVFYTKSFKPIFKFRKLAKIAKFSESDRL